MGETIRRDENCEASDVRHLFSSSKFDTYGNVLPCAMPGSKAVVKRQIIAKRAPGRDDDAIE
jgi:hypothetical protein